MSDFSDYIDCPRCDSDYIDCPRCDGSNTLITYTDSNPVPQESGNCRSCGFSYSTVFGMIPLVEVNYIRDDEGYLPLTELVKPVKEWLEMGYD